MQTVVVLGLLVMLLGGVSLVCLLVTDRIPTGERPRVRGDPPMPALRPMPEWPRWSYDGGDTAHAIVDGVPHRLSLEDDGTELTVRLQKKYIGKWRTVFVEHTTDRREADRLFDQWWLNPR